jgi:hypothetical protein
VIRHRAQTRTAAALVSLVLVATMVIGGVALLGASSDHVPVVLDHGSYGVLVAWENGGLCMGITAGTSPEEIQTSDLALHVLDIRRRTQLSLER